ncbi:MAG: AraC family transcriptional regulator [bacterium]|nr:AraC family transcriptional regulator [bacterium]
MEKEKPFLDPGLHLDTLPQMLSIPGFQLSYIINKKIGKKFFDFINQYRVIEAEKNLVDPEKNGCNILQIAYEVGFNSKSSFNIVFKKHAGVTPSKYRKNNLK